MSEDITKEIENKDALVEDTTGPNADNIETTDENLSVDQMYQQAALPSLARQIFSVVPMNGPTAALFNIQKKSGVNDAELLRNDVAVYPSEAIHTGLTEEAIQDILSQYGRETYRIVGTLLRGLANDQENTRALAFLAAESLSTPALTLTAPTNSVQNVREIKQRVNELIVLANAKNQKTFGAYVVLPYKFAASFMEMNDGFNDTNARGLFITKIGRTRYYFNPNVAATEAYVGLVDEENPSKSGAVMSPYTDTIVPAINSDSGERTFHIYNRFAITKSPLHIAGNEMMFRFTIA